LTEGTSNFIGICDILVFLHASGIPEIDEEVRILRSHMLQNCRVKINVPKVLGKGLHKQTKLGWKFFKRNVANTQLLAAFQLLKS
jgi:hypothetical protein